MAEGLQGSWNVHWADVLTIGLYFLLSLSVGIWSIWRRRGGQGVKGYFMAGRNMHWWPVGMSLFASNIGSEHFVGLAGSGAASGLAVIMFEWNAVIMLLLLGWIFLPVYIVSGIYTMPEYLSRRFGGQRLRIYLSIVALITFLFTNTSVDLYSGALFVQQALGWDILLGAVVLLGITALYTLLGGLSTVIFTDAMSVVVMMVGSIILSIMGFVRVGGFTNLIRLYNRAIPDYTLNRTGYRCGYPRQDAWHIFRDASSSDYPWLGILARTGFGGMWYWCANQLIVQRALAAKSITHAKAGCVSAGYLKLVPMFVMLLPGMIARALFPNDVACADPATCERVCKNRVGCSNIAYPKLVIELLPRGLRGMLLAVMMAAVVSSLTSIFNSASTIFTMDIWSRIRPHSGDRELLIVGRIFIALLAVVSVIWIPVMQAAEGGQIFKYATTVTGYMSSPTCAMFLLGMFSWRVNEPGVFWGMVFAQLIGLVRFILGFVYPTPACWDKDTRPWVITAIHPYYYNIIQVGVAFILAFAISLMFKPIPRHKLAGLTFWTRKEKPHYAEAEEKEDMERALEEAHRLREERRQKTQQENNRTMSAARRWVKNLCKNSNGKAEIVPVLKDEPFEKRLQSIKEPAFLKKLLNINAVIIVTILAFLYGFFH